MVFAYSAGKHNMMSPEVCMPHQIHNTVIFLNRIASLLKGQAGLVLCYLELSHANITIKPVLVNQHISVKGDVSQPDSCAAYGLAFVWAFSICHSHLWNIPTDYKGQIWGQPDCFCWYEQTSALFTWWISKKFCFYIIFFILLIVSCACVWLTKCAALIYTLY